jgi:uncharacterized membrane protein YvbJ
MHKSAATIPCPHCGEQINKNAKACPFCGSDEQTGWSDRTYLDSIDIDDDVDYDELVRNEFPEKSAAPKKRSWIVVAGAVVLLCFIAAMLKILF